GDVNPEDDMRRIEGIINSMTPDERNNPDLIDRGRRNRIARGSGVQAADVNKLLKDFTAMSRMMQDMSNLGTRDRLKAVRQLADGGFMGPGSDMADAGVRIRRAPVNLGELRDKRKKQKKDAKKQKKRNRKR
ncbi:MAG: signal recognition particle protein, partial [Planctomyces sp.]